MTGWRSVVLQNLFSSSAGTFPSVVVALRDLHCRLPGTRCSELQRRKHWEICQNTDSVLGTIWSSMDPKKVRKKDIFPDALFLHFTWDLSTCSAEVPMPSAQKGTVLPEVLLQRSKSCDGKSPHQRNTGYKVRRRSEKALRLE